MLCLTEVADASVVESLLIDAVSQIPADIHTYFGNGADTEEIYKQYLSLLTDLLDVNPRDVNKMISLLTEQIASIYNKETATKIISYVGSE